MFAKFAFQLEMIVVVSLVFVTILIFNTKARKRQADFKLFTMRVDNFGRWLASLAPASLTLSCLAEGVVHIFEMEYCSIHVYGNGKLRNLSGVCAGNLAEPIAESLRIAKDHPMAFLDVAEEQSLGVKNFSIRAGYELIALLVVKSNDLSNENLQAIASIIGVVLVHSLVVSS